MLTKVYSLQRKKIERGKKKVPSLPEACTTLVVEALKDELESLFSRF